MKSDIHNFYLKQVPTPPSISLILSTRSRIEEFAAFIQCVKETCSQPDKIEIIVKIDSDEDINVKNNILLQSSMQYKILSYARYRGYYDSHIFFNDMARLSNGSFIWMVCDDALIKPNFDWFSKITETRDKVFPDNIYSIRVNGDTWDKGRRYNSFPLITREWYNVLDMIGPFFPLDHFLVSLGNRIHRIIRISDQPFMIDFPYDQNKRDSVWYESQDSYRKFGKVLGRGEMIEKSAQVFLDAIKVAEKNQINTVQQELLVQEMPLAQEG